MPGKPSKELLTYAFIAHGYLGSGSALDGVSHLLSHLVGEYDGKTFDPVEIARAAETRIGLSLSPIVVESLVPSLVQLGCLVGIAEVGGQAAYRCKAVQEENFSISEVQIEGILAAFRAYAEPKLHSHGLAPSAADIDGALLAFLQTADFLSSWLQPDKSEFRGRVLSLRRDEEVPEEQKVGKALDTLCALFVQDTFDNDEKLFRKLVAVSWGAVVMEVVTTLQVGAIGDAGPLSDLTIFVDTPILLDLLDIGDEDQHRYATDLFALMSRSGVRIATFSHVIEEMRAAVEATLGRFARGEPFSGPMAKRLRSDPGYALATRMALAKLEDRLAANGVTIIPDADFETTDLLPFFPEPSVDSLRSRVGEIHRNVERRDRDAKSIAYVIRSRRGSTVSPVSQSKYVFVTRNVALCGVAKSYAEHAGLIPKYSAPPAVTDRQLAGVLWFCAGAPAKEASDLARNKIIANCASAVAPRMDVVSRMGQVLFDKDPKRLLEYEALIRDERAALCLTRETLNVVSLVDANKADELLTQMRNALTVEARQQFEIERADLISRYERARADSDEQRNRAATVTASEREKEEQLAATQLALSDLRAGHETQVVEVGLKIDQMQQTINGLLSHNDRAVAAVSHTLASDLTSIARMVAVISAVVIATAAFVFDRLATESMIATVLTIGLVATAYWILPQVLIHPLLRLILTRSAAKKARAIERLSGISVDCDAAVEEALRNLHSWGRGNQNDSEPS